MDSLHKLKWIYFWPRSVYYCIRYPLSFACALFSTRSQPMSILILPLHNDTLIRKGFEEETTETRGASYSPLRVGGAAAHGPNVASVCRDPLLQSLRVRSAVHASEKSFHVRRLGRAGAIVPEPKRVPVICLRGLEIRRVVEPAPNVRHVKYRARHMPAIRRASVAQPKIEKHHAARVRREGQGWSLPADSSSVLARLPKRLACRHLWHDFLPETLWAHSLLSCSRAARLQPCRARGDGERLIIPRFHVCLAITIICPNPPSSNNAATSLCHCCATAPGRDWTYENVSSSISTLSARAVPSSCWRSLSPKMRRRSESTGGLAVRFR